VLMRVLKSRFLMETHQRLTFRGRKEVFSSLKVWKTLIMVSYSIYCSYVDESKCNLDKVEILDNLFFIN